MRSWFVSLLVGSLAIAYISSLAISSTPGQAQTADGKTVYLARCAVCHGKEAGGTQVAPALTGLSARSDAELYAIIAQGVPQTAMPAWEKMLTPSEIKAVIVYLRALSRGAEEQRSGEAGEQGQVTSAPPHPSTSAQIPGGAIALEVTPDEEGGLVARAVVRDGQGQQRPGVSVVFYQRTLFGGRLPLGTAMTDAQGVAVFKYAAGAGRALTIGAALAPEASGSEVTVEIPGGEPWRPGGLISPTPPPLLIAILATVLGGVWLTYGFIAWQLINIFRVGGN